jgi:hypothetical protein
MQVLQTQNDSADLKFFLAISYSVYLYLAVGIHFSSEK